jgi:ABC-type multidrug transport system fused ATPase/permease subunit
MLLLLLVLVPTTTLYLVRRKKLQGISNDIKHKYPQLLKFALQSIEGFVEIKATEKEDFFHHRFNKMNKSITRTFIRDQLIQSVSIRLTEIIVGTILCFLVGYTVYMHEDYQQTLLLLGVYTGAGFRILPSVNRILHASQQIRMHEHLLSELGPLKNYRTTFSRASSAAPFQEMLQLREVTYGYPGGPLILDRLSINIKKGEKIVVTGNSGEGKTTFLLILLRLLKETQGSITVDNNPIMDDASWRKQIGYVSQNPYVLDATIAENIAYGIPSREIDRDKVKQLLDELGLAEVVQRLPDGIDTLIGERGITLSGGQRQRLAIARVLYAEVDVLLLDEITNQVHASMEEEILTALTAVGRREKTIIMIAHQLTHNDIFDSIYRMENGKLR